MTCAAAREAVLDLARGVAMPESLRLATESHASACAECAAELERQRDLTAALQTLAAEAQDWSASPRIERSLLAAFDAQKMSTAPAREPDRPGDRWVYALAVAALVALAVWIGSRAPRQPAATTTRGPGPVESAPVPSQAAPAPPVVAARPAPQPVAAAVKARPSRRLAPRPPRPRSFEFIPLPTAVGLPDLESGSVVRIQVPVSALPGYGVDIVPNGQKTTVEADVLVGQDGQPRAIRLVTAEETSTRDVRSRQ